MLPGHTDDRRNAGWWRALAWALAALAGLASGFVASLLSPLIACFCCGPFGGLLSGGGGLRGPAGGLPVGSLPGQRPGRAGLRGRRLDRPGPGDRPGAGHGSRSAGAAGIPASAGRRGFPGDGDGRPGDRDRPGPLPGRRRAASDLRRRRLAGREGGPGPSRP